MHASDVKAVRHAFGNEPRCRWWMMVVQIIAWCPAVSEPAAA
jgi:hypothetical protein